MMTWSQLLSMYGVIVAVVTVPLGIMVFYLKSVASDHKQLRQGQESLERRIGDVERAYTTREEWIREAAEQRQQIEKLTDLVVEMKTRSETEAGLTAQLQQLVRLLAETRKGQE